MLDRLLGLLGPFRATDVVDRDVHTLFAQPNGDCLSDPRATTGDDGHLSLQTLHGMRSLVCDCPSVTGNGRVLRPGETVMSLEEEDQRISGRGHVIDGREGAERGVPERLVARW